ncbi:MAG: branched-chain amino acid ABC transporter substrate-binding protein, partial [Pseudomonadota bacterium]
MPVLAETTLRIGYLRVEQPVPPTLSNLDPIPEDNGIAGAQTGLADNLTTGKFLGQTYEMSVVEVSEGEDPLAAAREMLAAAPYLVIDAAAEDMIAIADLPEAEGAVLFNTSAGALSLRDDACRGN